MKVVTTSDFEKQRARLPARVQRFCDIQLAHFTSNHRDPRLHIKKLTDVEGVYSFRITRNYRGLFYFDFEGNAVIFAIGDRKEIYR